MATKRIQLRSPKLDYDIDLLKALADETRRSILQFLCTPGGGEMLAYSVTEIAENFQLSTSTVSHHLQLLRREGLVQMEKAGKERLYNFNLPRFVEWADGLDDMFEDIEETRQKAAKARGLV